MKRALDANDADGIRTALNELQQAMMAVGQAAYGGGEQPEQPGGNGQGGATPEGTVEGEYREV